MDDAALFQFLVDNGIRWVQSQRDEHRPTARGLVESERSQLSLFIPPAVLDSARIQFVPVIENPPFYSTLSGRGIPRLLDFTWAVGITFKDTIIISKRFAPPSAGWMSLVFHEMVHVVQYHLLGLEVFIRRYIRGWVDSGFDYYAVPLEMDAYELQRRYERDSPGFSLVEEVSRRLGKGEGMGEGP